MTELQTCIIAEINQLHTEVCAAARTTIEKAIRIGELLTEQKSKLKHGEWLPWLESNVEFNVRTAQRYTYIFVNRDRLKYDNVSYLSDAYTLLSPTKSLDDIPDDSPKMSRAEAEEITEKIRDGLENTEIALIPLGGFLAKVKARKQYGESRTFVEFCRGLNVSPEIANIAIELHEVVEVARASNDAEFLQKEGTEIRMRLINLMLACEDEASLHKMFSGRDN